MSSTDIDYYVAAIHEELARQYQALVDQAGLRPKLRMRFAGDAAPDQPAAASGAFS
jgi:hypothetical protein